MKQEAVIPLCCGRCYTSLQLDSPLLKLEGFGETFAFVFREALKDILNDYLAGLRPRIHSETSQTDWAVLRFADSCIVIETTLVVDIQYGCADQLKGFLREALFRTVNGLQFLLNECERRDEVLSSTEIDPFITFVVDRNVAYDELLPALQPTAVAA